MIVMANAGARIGGIWLMTLLPLSLIALRCYNLNAQAWQDSDRAIENVFAILAMQVALCWAILGVGFLGLYNFIIG